MQVFALAWLREPPGDAQDSLVAKILNDLVSEADNPRDTALIYGQALITQVGMFAALADHAGIDPVQFLYDLDTTIDDED